MLERAYQAKLIKNLRRLFPGCIIIKNDPSYIQGIPDLIILWGDQWAALEVKMAEDSRERPNQRLYVETMNEMSFAAFINPMNEAEVLRELQFAFQQTRRVSRIS